LLIAVTNEDTTMSRPLITDMTTKELIDKVTDIFDIEFLMKIEQNKGSRTEKLAELERRHLAMTGALPDDATSNLAPLIRAMARDCSILRRFTAELTRLEAELKELVENAGWKRTNGQESRAIQNKRAEIEIWQGMATKKQKDVAERQKFFDYIEETDRKINELDDAAAGRAPTPAWFQAQLDAEWEAKKASIKRAYNEYEKSVRENKPYEPTT